MSSSTNRRVLSVGLAIVVLAAGWYGYRWLQVDSCLDGGGSFDYASRSCNRP
jgi:hypothetical protein